ncbi:HD domain-containing protein [Patescibacteria group bacterium]|nr:HD domain-containing protein [Patescibacteria group bacterium]
MTTNQLQKIDNFVKKATQKLDSQHGYGHLIRVKKNALQIVDILKINSKIDPNLLQAACFLHDIHFIKYKPSLKNWLTEGKLLRQVLPSIVKQFNLNESDRYILSEAVYNHTFSFPTKRLNQKYSLYAQIVQDADTLDFLSEIRILDLKKNKNKFKFYRFLSLFSGLAKYGRKRIKNHLNLPEIIDYLNED